MLDMVIIGLFVTAIIVMIIAAMVKLKKDQVREERDYWIQECAIREREAQFFAEMDERLVPRIMNRFGHDMQDYLIDRHLRQRYEEAYNELVIEQEYEEPKHSSFMLNKTQDDEDDPIVGYNLSEPNPAIRQSDILRMRAENAAKNKKGKSIPQSKCKLASDFIKKNATEEKTFFKEHDLMEDDFWEDSTAYDWADDDNGDLLTSAETMKSKVIPFSKTKGNGRPKIHSSPAAKQQAYRERQKQRMAAHA